MSFNDYELYVNLSEEEKNKLQNAMAKISEICNETFDIISVNYYFNLFYEPCIKILIVNAPNLENFPNEIDGFRINIIIEQRNKSDDSSILR